MGNGASRLFNVMKRTSKSTNISPSQVVSLTVKSIQPLVFMRDDRLEITEDFCTFNQSFDINKLSIGDIVLAMVFNNGQTYFIQQNDSSSQELIDKNELRQLIIEIINELKENR